MEGVLRFVVYRFRESLEGVSQTHYFFDGDMDLLMGLTARSPRPVEPIGVYEVPLGSGDRPLPSFVKEREVAAGGQIKLEVGTVLSFGSWYLNAVDVAHGRFVDSESGQAAPIRPVWTEADGPIAG